MPRPSCVTAHMPSMLTPALPSASPSLAPSPGLSGSDPTSPSPYRPLSSETVGVLRDAETVKPDVQGAQGRSVSRPWVDLSARDLCGKARGESVPRLRGWDVRVVLDLRLDVLSSDADRLALDAAIGEGCR